MENLQLLENELVPVYETSTGKKVVYGTELHAVLEVKTKYTDWVSRRFNECDAVENKDFQTCFSNLGSKTQGGQNKKDHIIKLDTAKEMAMLERNDKGKQVRRYFIRIEEKYKELKEKLSRENQLILSIVNSNDKETRVMALSEYKDIITAPLLEDISQKEKVIECQDNKLQTQKPFVQFALSVQQKCIYLTFEKAAKIVSDNYVNIGRNTLMLELRKHSVLMDNNSPYEKYKKAGLFVCTLKEVCNSRVKVIPVTLVTGKGLIFIKKKLREWYGLENLDINLEEFDRQVKEMQKKKQEEEMEKLLELM